MAKSWGSDNVGRLYFQSRRGDMERQHSRARWSDPIRSRLLPPTHLAPSHHLIRGLLSLLICRLIGPNAFCPPPQSPLVLSGSTPYRIHAKVYIYSHAGHTHHISPSPPLADPSSGGVHQSTCNIKHTCYESDVEWDISPIRPPATASFMALNHFLAEMTARRRSRTSCTCEALVCVTKHDHTKPWHPNKFCFGGGFAWESALLHRLTGGISFHMYPLKQWKWGMGNVAVERWWINADGTVLFCVCVCACICAFAYLHILL